MKSGDGCVFGFSYHRASQLNLTNYVTVQRNMILTKFILEHVFVQGHHQMHIHIERYALRVIVVFNKYILGDEECPA
jgi:hypothetical protein